MSCTDCNVEISFECFLVNAVGKLFCDDLSYVIRLHIGRSTKFRHPVTPSILANRSLRLTYDIFVVPQVGIYMVAKLPW